MQDDLLLEILSNGPAHQCPKHQPPGRRTGLIRSRVMSAPIARVIDSEFYLKRIDGERWLWYLLVLVGWQAFPVTVRFLRTPKNKVIAIAKLHATPVSI